MDEEATFAENYLNYVRTHYTNSLDHQLRCGLNCIKTRLVKLLGTLVASFLTHLFSVSHSNTASVTHRQARVTNHPPLRLLPQEESISKRIAQVISRFTVTMSLTCAISMWLLLIHVLVASASLSGRIVPLCVRQPSTQSRFREHREHYQETFL